MADYMKFVDCPGAAGASLAGKPPPPNPSNLTQIRFFIFSPSMHLSCQPE